MSLELSASWPLQASHQPAAEPEVTGDQASSGSTPALNVNYPSSHQTKIDLSLRAVLISSPSQTKIRGLNSAAKIHSARNIVPHYSHFICKLAFTWSVSQLSLPQPVSLKDPSLRLATTALSQSENPPGTPNRLFLSVCLCFAGSLSLVAQTETQKGLSVSLCFDSERPLQCPVFCQIS